MNKILSAAAVLLCMAPVLSCHREAKVISEKDMASIYADMFIADQWVDDNFKVRRTADTSEVYSAVFVKYGYTSDDYRHSVEHYMQDPDNFSKILRNAANVLEKKVAEKTAERKRLQAIAEMTPDTLVQFDFARVYIFEKGCPRLVSRDSIPFFKEKGEYFILDLLPLAQKDSTAIISDKTEK